MKNASRTEKVAKSNEMSITCHNCSINFHVPPSLAKGGGSKFVFFFVRSARELLPLKFEIDAAPLITVILRILW